MTDKRCYAPEPCPFHAAGGAKSDPCNWMLGIRYNGEDEGTGETPDIHDDESCLLDILERRGAPWIADVIQCAETDMDPIPRMTLIERIQRGGKQGKP